MCLSPSAHTIFCINYAYRLTGKSAITNQIETLLDSRSCCSRTEGATRCDREMFSGSIDQREQRLLWWREATLWKECRKYLPLSHHIPVLPILLQANPLRGFRARTLIVQHEQHWITCQHLYLSRPTQRR